MIQKIVAIFLIIGLCLYSCKTSDKADHNTIIELKPFSKDIYYMYHYSTNEYYLDGNNKIDSFKPIIYTNVKPLENNKNIPQKIYALRNNSHKKSKKYFYNDLKGMSIVYLEKDDKIIFRNYYKSYTGKDFNKYDITKPRSKKDLIKYFKFKKVNFKILNTTKSENADVVKAEVGGLLYKIVVDSTFCKSYLYYKKQDTINNFQLITDDAFYDGF